MFQITVRTPPRDRYLGFEDEDKALDLGQVSIGKGVRDIGCKEVV